MDNVSDHASPDNSQLLKGWLPALIIVIGFWILLFNHQRMEWSVNATYAYGYAIPFLAGYLLYERWKLRPQTKAPRWRLPAILAILVVLAGYLPLRVIAEANPDWVKNNWMLELVGFTIAFSALYAAGGWRYLLHFGFPILFCFTALPWPVWLEDSLIQNLMKSNASLCADILTTFGLPAIAKGNIIHISGHSVNVEEACSGIRSLQTAFMMSLFLGEFHRLGFIRRLLLVPGSFLLAALFNALRTITLTYLATKDSLDEWHDTVGNIAMVLTLVAVWGLSELLARVFRKNKDLAVPERPGAGERSHPLPWWLAIVTIAWLGGAEAFTQYWYRSHEVKVSPPLKWTVNFPTKARYFKDTPLHDRTLALLKYNQGKSASWVSEYGYGWQVYFLEWEPGRVSKHLAMSHYPTVCLPAVGLNLIGETGDWDFVMDGLRIPFRTYVFTDGHQDVYMFHAIIEDRPLVDNFRFQYYQVSSSERIDAVLRGERNLGQKVMGIAIKGPMSPNEARYEVNRVLRKLIEKTPTTPTPQATK